MQNKYKMLDTFTKIIEDEEEKIALEVELQTVAHKYSFAPEIYDYGYNYDDEEGVIDMEFIDEVCLADKYGVEPENIPEYIWDKIRCILNILFFEEGICYIDITPYNFIEKDGEVYIIDFGDAYYSKNMNEFLNKFLVENHNGWNPDFK